MIHTEQVFINHVEYVRATSDEGKWLELNGERSNEFLYFPGENPPIIETEEYINEEQIDVQHDTTPE